MNSDVNRSEPLLREQGVGGSNPLAPTNSNKDLANSSDADAPEIAPERQVLAGAAWLFPLFIKAGFEAVPGEHVKSFAERLVLFSCWFDGTVVGVHNDVPMFVIPGMTVRDALEQWEAVFYSGGRYS